jgi:hypothetical protein
MTVTWRVHCLPILALSYAVLNTYKTVTNNKICVMLRKYVF